MLRAVGAGSIALSAGAVRLKEGSGGGARFKIGLNTSTLRGHKLPIAEVVDIAAEAGYEAIEPWVDELDRHVESGGSLKDLGRRIKDRGLKVTGAIAFYEWMVDDADRRAGAIEQAKLRMGQLDQIGATHIAAAPCGDVGKVELLAAADRYRQLLETSKDFGVTPAVEIWGKASNLFRLGQAVMVAMESHHPRACILPDVFHLYRGGSSLDGIGQLSGSLLAGFHLNDYPALPPREEQNDSDRVYPGDGVAPLVKLLQDLRAIGYQGSLSIELFNPEYYAQDPREVAKVGLARTRALMEKSLGQADP